MLRRSSDRRFQDIIGGTGRGSIPFQGKRAAAHHGVGLRLACWALHDGKSWGVVLMANIRRHAHSVTPKVR